MGNILKSNDVVFGDGNGGWLGWALVGGGKSGNYAIAVADVNRDGILDVVGATTLLALGDGIGGFTVNYVFPLVEQNTRQLAFLDINKDGILDVVAANPYGIDGPNSMLIRHACALSLSPRVTLRACACSAARANTQSLSQSLSPFARTRTTSHLAPSFPRQPLSIATLPPVCIACHPQPPYRWLRREHYVPRGGSSHAFHRARRPKQ